MREQGGRQPEPRRSRRAPRMGDPPANAWSDSTRENKEKRRPERERTETRSIRKETAAGHAEEPPDSEKGAEKLYTMVLSTLIYMPHRARESKARERRGATTETTNTLQVGVVVGG